LASYVPLCGFKFLSMNVYVTFEPSGCSGLVASGTYLWDAAKRLGVKLPSGCDSRSECDNCFLTIKEGTEFLSPVTDLEREKLGEDKLNIGERLACQAKIIGAGDVVIHVPSEEEIEEPVFDKFAKEFGKLALDKKHFVLAQLGQATVRHGFRADLSLIEHGETANAFRKEFDEMSQAQKIVTVTKLESGTAIHTAFSVLNLPYTIGEKLLDFMAVKGRKIHQEEKENKQ